jgi:aminoglycoside phosphotransferase (APT) family kinase protein
MIRRIRHKSKTMPPRAWDPEVVVGEKLARELIGTQFPDVDAEPLELLGEGWDNTVWRTADDIVFRFPRRQIAVAGVEREIAVLPALASRLPVPVPDASLVGAPTLGFPWPWFGHRMIEGVELAAALLDDAARIALGVPLGRFLRELHGVVPPAGLPVDPNGRADMSVRIPMTREALEAVGVPPPSELLERAQRLPAPDRLVLAHGDLHVRHVLVEGRGGLAGVIDWGDVCRADPGIDLSLVWSALPPAGRDAFFAAYGAVGEESLLRARVLALFLCATLARYARAEGMPVLEREALAGLERALS